MIIIKDINYGDKHEYVNQVPLVILELNLLHIWIHTSKQRIEGKYEIHKRERFNKWKHKRKLTNHGGG